MYVFITQMLLTGDVPKYIFMSDTVNITMWRIVEPI